MKRGEFNIKIRNLSKKAPKLRFEVNFDRDGDVVGLTIYDVQEGQEPNAVTQEAVAGPTEDERPLTVLKDHQC